jgi:anti-sigma B factor antagonist
VFRKTEPFSIESRRRSQAMILDLEGDFVLGPALAAFRLETRAALVDPIPAVLILNLGRVQRVDSSGLGELFLLHSVATPLGVKVALAGPSPRVLSLLSMTRMDGIFPSFADEQAAVGALAASGR